MKNEFKDPVLGDILEKVKTNYSSDLNLLTINFPSYKLSEYPDVVKNVSIYKSIKLKPFIGKDINEILQKLTNVSASQYINNLLDVLNVFINKLNPDINFDIKNLMAQDYYFLLLGFRTLNAPTVITKEFTCPHNCGYSGEKEINLSDIDFSLPENLKESDFEITLPNSKLKINLQYYPVKRLFIPNVNYTDLIVYSIYKIENKELSIPDIKIVINNLSSDDLLTIKNKIDYISNWGVGSLEFKCPKCGKPIYYTLPGDLDFFFPFLQ